MRQLARLNSNTKAQSLSSGAGRKAYEKAEGIMKQIAALNNKELEEQAGVPSEAIDSAKAALLSARVVQDMITFHRGEKNLILATTKEEMDEFSKSLAGYEETLNNRVDQLEPLMTTAKQEKLLSEFKGAWKKFDVIDDEVRELSRENGNKRAFDLASSKGRVLLDESQALMTAIVRANDQGMVDDKKASDAKYSTARNLMITVGLTGIALSLFLGLYLIRSIISAFRELFKGLKSFSGRELNDTSDKFKVIIDTLESSTEQVSSASGQLSSSSQTLAEGSSEQASSIEETSASLEEMSSMTKSNAENAGQADTLMKEAIKSMNDLSQSIEKMNEASEETGKIIKTIDEIAFQTNLLALNAAVEAARAGESGKGFAVVADEVRSLALRAAEASKNTATLIEETLEKSERGVRASDGNQ